MTHSHKIMIKSFDRKLFNSINEKITESNVFLSDANVPFKFLKIENHFIDRINDRNIDPYLVNKVISFALKNKIHEICTGLVINNQYNKITIQYDDNFFIHATYLIDDFGLFKIKLRTIIPYRKNYIIGDSVYIKINKLITR